LNTASAPEPTGGGVDTRAVRRAAIAAALLAGQPAAISDPGAVRFRQLAEFVGALARRRPPQESAPTAPPQASPRLIYDSLTG
jgi:hypothetical protein